MKRKRIKIKRDYDAIEEWAKSSETHNITLGNNMKLVEDFRKIKPQIIDHVRKKGIGDIGSYAAMTGIALYPIWVFIEEEFPEYEEEAKKRQEILKNFYGYKDE